MAAKARGGRITLAELQDRIADPRSADEDLAPYVMLDAARSGPLSPRFVLNPETVALPQQAALRSRSALGLNLLNDLMRTRRRIAFERRLASGYAGPVLVSEGDSWFQHPLLTDTIDHLSATYAIRSLDAAGDLLEDIVRDGEYLTGLRDTGAPLLLLSAGGNDALGGGNLREHLRDFDPAISAEEHLLPSYRALIDHALSLYDTIFRAVERLPGVRTLCHGYDYAVPAGGVWLGQPMAARGITNPAFQRAIVRVMVDGFNARLGRVAGRFPGVQFLDLRNTVGEGRWHDELHPTREGYAAVAQRFDGAIQALRPAAAPGRRRGVAATRPARRGLSLHVGVNTVDPAHYSATADLVACGFDAADMAAIAHAEGFAASPVLLDAAATRAAVMDEIRKAAGALRGGDLFLFTYSGHGSWLPDQDGDEVLDGRDETFCLYDGMMLDDELYALWAGFADDVRVLVVSDSCHSGTSVRAIPLAEAPPAPPADGAAWRSRRMPPAIAGRTLRNNRDFYARLSRPAEPRPGQSPVRSLARPLRCSVQLLAACQDNQEALDGLANGLFTERLLGVWNNGAFTGTYDMFHRQILRGMPAQQTPGFWATGKPSPAFRGQRPFSI